MVHHVTRFLLRFLYVNNLIRDRAEIQNLPWYHGHQHQQHHEQHSHPPQQQQQQQQHPAAYSTQTASAVPASADQYDYGQQQQQQQHSAHPPPPPPPPGGSLQPPQSHAQHPGQHPQHQHHGGPPYQQQHRPPPQQPTPAEEERRWRHRALLSVASYPPGSSSRLYALDALRMEIVLDFARELNSADAEYGEVKAAQRSGGGGDFSLTRFPAGEAGSDDGYDGTAGAGGTLGRTADEEEEYDTDLDVDEDDDPFLDADLEIIDEFARRIREGPSSHVDDSEDESEEEGRASDANGEAKAASSDEDEDEDQAVLVISPPGESSQDQEREYAEAAAQVARDAARAARKAERAAEDRARRLRGEANDPTPADADAAPRLSDEEIRRRLESSRALRRSLRLYLPQLVSAVLHSPPPLTSGPGSLDPLSGLRSLLLDRCLADPSLGIELCWLLEAEVGRAWKTLFEHRQRTGRRLIVVLPAEKAAAIAQIGTEKRGAFDLLQDAEQATAYGVCAPPHHHHHHGEGDVDEHDLHAHPSYLHDNMHSDAAGFAGARQHRPRLPSSLSLRRCAHYGDAMHLIDMLTSISLDLRMTPQLRRTSTLRERLHELNRRIRRRMVTMGEVSLDVDDGLGCDGWPTIESVPVEGLRHGVHFPLEPRGPRWPDGGTAGGSSGGSTSGIDTEEEDNPDGHGGAVRVLNVVVPECVLLASRERCPFLVRMEVADTGLEPDDPRLYGAGARGLGGTIEECLGTSLANLAESSGGGHRHHGGGGFSPHRIPDELLDDGEWYAIARRRKGGGARDSDFGEPPDLEAEEEGEDDRIDPAAVPRGGADYVPHEADPHNAYAQGGAGGEGGGGVGEHYDDGFYFPDTARQGDIEEVHAHLQQHQEQQQQQQEQMQQQMQHQQQWQYTQGGYATDGTGGPVLRTYRDLLDGVYGPEWAAKCEEVRRSSPYGHIKGWRLASFIMKAGEDIRREALVMQVIERLRDWFEEEIGTDMRPYLRPYTLMCVGGDAGLLECVTDAKSVDEVKKETDGFTTLRDYFERAYGPPGSFVPTPDTPTPPGGVTFERAQDNFLRSLVGSSLVCYILQIKDRHNANILLDREGHILHIDFGFVLGDTPKMGKVPIFSERAPFKLTQEFWEVIGGWNYRRGGLGVKFCKMFEAAFACAASHVDEIAGLIEAAMLNLTGDADVARSTANGVRERLRMRGERHSAEFKNFIVDLVDGALTSWETSTYDWLQRSMNGYQ